MHVALPIGQNDMLMASDTFESMGPFVAGNNFSVSIHAESAQEATRLFNGLSKGGKITIPLDKTFWAALFGMFTDILVYNGW